MLQATTRNRNHLEKQSPRPHFQLWVTCPVWSVAFFGSSAEFLNEVQKLRAFKDVATCDKFNRCVSVHVSILRGLSIAREACIAARCVRSDNHKVNLSCRTEYFHGFSTSSREFSSSSTRGHSGRKAVASRICLQSQSDSTQSCLGSRHIPGLRKIPRSYSGGPERRMESSRFLSGLEPVDPYSIRKTYRHWGTTRASLRADLEPLRVS
jgi:hypothetical protein